MPNHVSAYSSPYYHEHSLFIESIRKFMQSELSPQLRHWEELGSFPNSVFTALAAQGFLGMLLPEEYGGSAGDYKLAGAWCEAFGELCDLGLVTAINMHALVIAPAIARLGTTQAKQRWLPAAVRGEAIGAYAFTEPGAGSDLASARTKATKTSAGWLIEGSKIFITNGARAHFVLVLARTDPSAGYRGFSTFVVDTSLPGFSVSKKLDKLGWRSSDTAELLLERVEVPDWAVLGEIGAGWVQASKNLNWERLMLTLTTLGAMRACLAETVTYAQQRHAFGKAIIEFAAVADPLLRGQDSIILGEALCHHALDLLLAGKECRAEVSAAKRLVCEDALLLADRAIQTLGGYGYTREFNAEKWWREIRLMPIGGGTSEIMANIVAKERGWL
jgi:acyl-CoA dehydrogenase